MSQTITLDAPKTWGAAAPAVAAEPTPRTTGNRPLSRAARRAEAARRRDARMTAMQQMAEAARRQREQDKEVAEATDTILMAFGLEPVNYTMVNGVLALPGEL